jgi:hypothetical protein
MLWQAKHQAHQVQLTLQAGFGKDSRPVPARSGRKIA